MTFWPPGGACDLSAVQVKEGMEGFAAAYLNNIVIYSNSGEEHLQHLHVGRSSGLTIHPKKCSLAHAEAWYLGYVLGGGLIMGWSNCFVPDFATRAAVPTDLIHKSGFNEVMWKNKHKRAF